MFQDQEILNEIRSLSPLKQAEVVDFIQFLKQKQQTHQLANGGDSQKLELAAELLLNTPSDLAPEEIALWDAIVNDSAQVLQIGEPELRGYD